MTCEKLPAKYDTYSSFHITVKETGDIIDGVLNCMLSNDSWPPGLLVRKYYFNPNNVSE